MLEFNGTDLVGNVGSELTVTGIVFDGAPPTFIKAWEYDTDGNGNIDEVVVEMSEAVSDASVVFGDFSIGGGNTVDGFSTATGASANTKDAADNDKYLTLEVSVTGTATASVSYTDNDSGGDLEDLAGNDAASNASVTVDDQAIPVVLSVSSNSTGATYQGGDVIDVLVTFSEAVDVTNTPQMILAVGSPNTSQTVDYTSGTGNAALRFDYTVQSGDVSDDLDYVGTGSLILNGGTIKDGSSNTNDGVLTLASPGDPNSLGNNEALVIDGVYPTFEKAWQYDTDGDGNIDEIVVELSEAVSDGSVVFGDFSISGGNTVDGFSTATGASANTKDAADNDKYLTLEVSVTGTATVGVSYTDNDSGNDLEDLSGNDAASNGSMIVDDQAVPVVLSVSSATAAGKYEAGDVIDVLVTFSEPVDVTGTPRIVIATGATTTSQNVNYTSGSTSSALQFDYTVQTSDASDDLDYVGTGSLELNTGAIKDRSLNTNNAVLTLVSPGDPNSLGNNEAIEIDGVFSTFVKAWQYDTDVDGNIDEIVVELSEAVSDASVDFGDFTLGSGSITGFSDATGASANTKDAGDNDKYLTLEVSVTGTADVTVAYANDDDGNDLEDLGGNEVATNASISTDDQAAPAIIAAQTMDIDGDGKIDRIDMTLSENLDDDGGANFASNSFTLGSSYVVGSVVTGDTGDDHLLRINVTEKSDVDSDIKPTVTMNGSKISDADGNMTAQSAFTPTDGVSPTFIKAWEYDTDGNGNIDEVVVEMSEAVSDASVVFGDFSIGGGNTVDGFSTATGASANTKDAADNDKYLTLEVSVTGTATASVSYTDNDSGGDLEDLAGNDAASNASVTVDDQAIPVVLSVSSNSTGATYQGGDVIDVLVTFSEAVDVTNTPQMILAVGSPNTSQTVDYTSGTGNAALRFDYTVQSGDVSDDLDYVGTGSLILNGGTIKDGSSNTNDGVLTLASPGDPNSLGNNEALVIDGVYPTFEKAWQYDTDGDGNIDEIVVELSEAVSDGSVVFGDFSISGGNTVDGFSTATGASANTKDAADNDKYLTLEVSVTGTATVGVSYTDNDSGNDLEDLSGNDAASNGSMIVDDQAVPVVLSVSSATAAGKYEAGDVIDVLVTFSEPVDVTGTPRIVIATGATTTSQNVNYTSGSTSSALQFDYTVQTSDASDDLDYVGTGSLELNTGAIKDRSLNTNNAVLTLVSPGDPNSLGNNEAIEIDGVFSTFVKAWQYDTDVDGNIDEIVVELSEAVSDASVDFGDFTLGSGSITGFSDATGASANTKDAGDNDKYLTLEVSVTGTADVTVAYANDDDGNDLEDLGGNEVATNASISTDDQAAPAIIAAQTMDIDGDGKIDRIDMTLSENLDDDGGANFASNSFTLGSSYVVGSVVTGDTGDDHLLRINVTEKSDVDSDIKPTVTMNGSKISDADGNMTAQSAFTPTDGVSPTFIKAWEYDTDGNGNIDEVVVEMSEAVSDASVVFGDFSIGGGNTVDGFSTATGASANTKDAADNDKYLTLEVSVTGTATASVSYTDNDSGGDLEDLAGNDAASNASVTVDDQAIPVVLSVSSNSTGATYQGGDVIDVLVTFSEAVDVTNTPQMILAVGSPNTSQTVDYTSGTGNAALRFDYTVQSGDVSDDLDYVGTGSLILNGGTIKDGSSNTNDGVLTLASPGDPNSLGNNEALVIDGVYPTFEKAWQYDTDGDGNIDEIVVELSEAVSDGSVVFGDFSISGGNTVDGFSTATGASANTKDAADNDKYLTLEVSVTGTATVGVSYTDNDSGNDLEDLSGNDAASNGSMIVDDQAVPVVLSVSSATAAGKYEAGDVIDVLVTFSEPVDVTGTPRIVIATGATTTSQNVNYTSGSTSSALQFDYTVQTSDASDDLDYVGTGSLELNTGAIKDRSLNTNNAVLTLVSPGDPNSLGNNEAIEIDGVFSTFVKAWQYDTDVDGNIDEIVVELSEAVSDASVDFGDFTLGSGSITGFSDATGASANTKDAGDNDKYLTLEVSVTGTADVTVAYANDDDGNDLEDLGGNEVATNASISTDDQAAPAIIAAQTMDIDGDGKIDRIDMTLSENLDDDGGANFASNSFTLGSSYVVGSVVTGDTGDDHLLRINVTEKSDVDSDIKPTVTMNGSKISDADGNMTAQSAFTPTDGVSPTFIKAWEYDTDGNGNIDEVVVEMSEAVSDASVVFGDFSIGGGNTVDGFSTATGASANTKDAADNDKYLTLEVSVTGTATASVSYTDNDSGGDLEDLAGNDAASNASVTVDDQAIPVVLSVSSNSTGATYQGGDVIDVLVTFSEAVDVTNTPQMILAVGSPNTSQTVDYTSGTGNAALRFDYTVQSGDVSDDLDYVGTGSLILNGGTIKDGSSNTNDGVLTLASPGDPNSLGNNEALVIDGVYPTFEKAWQYDTDGDGNIDEIVVELSEAVSDGSVVFGDFSISGGNTVDGFSTATGASANTKDAADNDKYLTLEVSVTGTATVGVSYTDNDSGNDLEDLSGNDAASNGSMIVDDQAVPVVLSVSSATAAGKYEAGDVIDVLVTFSEPVDVTGTPRIVIATGATTTSQNVNYTSGSTSSALQFDYTVQTSDASDDLDYVGTGSLELNTGAIKDRSLNTNNAVLTLVSPGDPNSLGNNEAIEIDGVFSTFVKAWQYDTDVDGNIDEIVVELSEAVSDASVDFGDFTLGSGSITGFSDATGASANTKDAGDNDKYLTLEVSVTGTADVTVAYANDDDGNDLEDLGGNEVATNASISTDDQAAPAIIAAQTMDIDGDGKIDRIDMTLSENLDDDGGANFASNSFTLGSSYVVGSVVTGDTGDDHLLRINVTEKSDVDSDIKPTVTMNGSKISDADGNMTAQSAFTPTDGVSPTFIKAWEYDTDGNGNIDEVVVEMSEAVSDASVVFGDFSIGGGNTVDGFSTATGASANTKDAADNDKYLTLEVSVTGTATASVSYTDNDSGGDLEDLAGNDAASNASVTVDDQAIPVVLSVSSNSTGATYQGGDVIDVLVTFSEAVDVTNTPQMILAVGSPNTSQTVDYTSGTGNAALRFDYTVQSGDVSDDLDYVGTGSLILNGGTIKDGSSNTNDGVLTLASPGDPNSLGNNEALVIDGVYPTFEKAWQYDTDGDGNIDEIVVELSEAVSDGSVVFGDFSISGGNTVDGFSTATGASANTKDAADNDKYLTLEVSVTGTATVGVSYTDNDSGNDLEDLSGNDAASNGSMIVDDQAVPVVLSVSSATAAGKYEAGDVIDVLVTFSEPVDVTGTPRIVIATGATTTSQNVNYTSGSTSSALQFDYTVQTSDASDDLDYVGTGSLELNTGAIKDRSLNTNNAVLTLVSPGDPNSLGNNEAIEIDGVFSTFVKAWQYDTDVDGNIDEIVVELSEAVSDASVDFGDFTLGSGSITGFSDATGASANTKDAGDNDKYLTLEVSVTGTADVTVAYANDDDGNDLEDLGGNEVATNASISTDDQAAPAIIAAQTMDIDGDGKIDRIDMTFSENLDDDGGANFASNSFTLGSSYVVGSVVTGDTGDDHLLRINVTEKSDVDSDIKPTVTMNGSKISDADGNMTAQSAFTPTDAAKPIITNARWQDAQVDELIDRVSLTFSEPVNIVDGNSGDGFGAILVNDGSAVTIDNDDYAASGVINLNINFSGDQSNLTAGASGLSATYEDSGANSIKDLSGNEITDGGTAFDYTERMLTCMDNEYIALQNSIVISESSAADFSDAGTLIFTLSSNFAFEPVGDATSIITDGLISGSDDIAITAAVITSSTITITYTNDGNASGVDKITIGTGFKNQIYGIRCNCFWYVNQNRRYSTNQWCKYFWIQYFRFGGGVSRSFNYHNQWIPNRRASLIN